MKLSEIEIIDNFLCKEDFKLLEKIFEPCVKWEFAIVLNEPDRTCDPKYNYQYVHLVACPRINEFSSFYNNIIPFLNKLNARALVRCKINSICREEEIVVHGFHTDVNYLEDHPTKFDGMKTAILYLNTNNGFTVFEDGTKVESVANRCVIFPAHYKHSGSTCTDVHRRLALNLVYF